MSSSDAHNHSTDHSKEYLFVFIALLVLTVITVAIAQVDFGSLNLVVAMAIASIKAFLVASYFMHLREENSITIFYAFVPIVLLALMMIGVFIDTPYRIDPKTGGYIQPSTEKVEDKGHH